MLPGREGLGTQGLAGGKPLRAPGIELWEGRHSHRPEIRGHREITGEAPKLKGWTDGPWGKKPEHDQSALTVHATRSSSGEKQLCIFERDTVLLILALQSERQLTVEPCYTYP